jgi:hypothetical protein
MILRSTEGSLPERLSTRFGTFTYQLPIDLTLYEQVTVFVGGETPWWDETQGDYLLQFGDTFEVTTCKQEPTETGTVTVVLEPADLPAGAEVCLVSETTELCKDVPDPSVELPNGALAFAQPANLLEVVFEHVPPRLYQIILRAAGFQDLVIGEANLGAGGTVETSPIPAATQEQIQPVEDFLAYVIALIIAILLELLAAHGG